MVGYRNVRATLERRREILVQCPDVCQLVRACDVL